MFVALQYWRINILLLLFAHDYVCILSFFFYGPLAPEINDISYLILRNLEVGYFDLLLWAVRVMICAATFCIGGKCSVVLCLKNRKYGGVSSLTTIYTGMYTSIHQLIRH